ncbi:MAG: thiamine diphosphokinase [Pseudomonadota bacterium]|nr:thiamine diphosphokinase [Pseudomonadota bacterium]
MAVFFKNLNSPAIFLGGAGFTQKDLDYCLNFSSTIVSADRGLDYLSKRNKPPSYLIGDLDSVQNKSYWEGLGTKVVKIAEQETTDFEKCLYSFDTPLFLCLGFVGRRVDHFLANCASLVKFYEKKIVLIGSHDIIFHVPKTMTISLEVGTRFSLFPLESVEAYFSQGLKWPIDGLKFQPSVRVGTSNETVNPDITLELSTNGMLLILPKKNLRSVLRHFVKAGF